MSDVRAAKEQGRILVVDDDDGVRSTLTRFFGSRGFAVDTATSGAEALERVLPGRYALAICDVRMPGMSGLELLPRLLERDVDLAVLMLSALSDPSTAGEALALGALEHLAKPISLGELQLAVERALRRRTLAIEQRATRVAPDTRPVESGPATAAVPEASHSLVRLVDMFEAREPCFGGMSIRVARTAEALCRRLGLPAELQEQITLAARLHDVGRVVVDPAILSKPGPLTPPEFEQVKQHVALGVEILEPLLGRTPALAAVREHHEHWDGRGYPQGLAAEDISLGGRILCAADAFVALTSRRPYREALSPSDAFDILNARSGSILDPAIVEALRPSVAAAPESAA